VKKAAGTVYHRHTRETVSLKYGYSVLACNLKVALVGTILRFVDGFGGGGEEEGKEGKVETAGYAHEAL
jgi:hypothetical protein